MGDGGRLSTTLPLETRGSLVIESDIPTLIAKGEDDISSPYYFSTRHLARGQQ